MSILDEVAVIDEIQMIRDPQRGWAWTRALLGLMAEEVHLCGEAGAVNLVSQLCLTTGEDIEIRNYKRLTDLKIEDQALGTRMRKDCSLKLNSLSALFYLQEAWKVCNQAIVLYVSVKTTYILCRVKLKALEKKWR